MLIVGATQSNKTVLFSKAKPQSPSLSHAWQVQRVGAVIVLVNCLCM